MLLLFGAVFASEPKFLIVYSRHGARTGKSFFPDKYDPAQAQIGRDELTPNGLRMHYVLGREIRKRYPSIFDNKDMPFDMYNMSILASDMERTQMSALAQAYGILGADYKYQGQVSSDPAAWTPPFQGFNVEFAEKDQVVPFNIPLVPLKTVPYEHSALFISESNKQSCPGYKPIFDDNSNKLNAKYESKIGEVVQALEKTDIEPQKYYGKPKWALDFIAYLRSDSECYEYYYGFVPPRIPLETQEKMRRLHYLHFASQYNEPTVKDVASDPMAREIFDSLQSFIEDPKGKPVFKMYLGHDGGLLAHQLKFNLNSVECLEQELSGIEERNCDDTPGFASSFMYEIHYFGFKHYVKILWNGRPVRFCLVDEADNLCEWSIFKKRYQEYFFMNEKKFDDICQNPKLEKYYEQKKVLKTPFKMMWFHYFIPIAAIIVLLLLIVWRVFSIIADSRVKSPERNIELELLNTDK